MCTAATYQTKDFYFGRNLDYEFSYGEQLVVTPRNYPFQFRQAGELSHHYAILGMAHVAEGYPLYYDAINEAGLCVAGLNFVGNAVYHPAADGKENIAQFELIPWLLGRCANLAEARALLENANLLNLPFSPQYPLAALHWMIADRTGCITLESTADGLHVYDNPAGVLANNPPFPLQMFNLNNYMNLSPRQPENQFAPELPLATYSRGMGGLGLPGDLSSQSRFVRAAFVRNNARSAEDETSSVSQLFHILGSVEQQKGCCEVAPGKYEYTIYTSCCNADKGIYYYTTYDQHQISAVDMHRENLDGNALVCFPMNTEPVVFWQNAAKQ